MSREKENRSKEPGFARSRGPRVGGGRHGLGLLEKPKDFKGTFRRLIAYLQPHLGKTVFVFILAILSTAFGILSPRILGLATTELYESVQGGRAIYDGRGIPNPYIRLA